MRKPDLSPGNVRWRLANGRVHASNAWYRAAGRRIGGSRQQYRNWLSTRALVRGKRPLPDRVTNAVGSRTPVYRKRINPATGRPRRNDRDPGRLRDRSLAQMTPQRQQVDTTRWRPSHSWDIGPRRRLIEIDGPDGRLLAHWEGWSMSHRAAVARADALRTDRRPTSPARAPQSRPTRVRGRSR